MARPLLRYTPPAAVRSLATLAPSLVVDAPSAPTAGPTPAGVDDHRLTRLEDQVALLMQAVDALLRHTDCRLPLPAPWQPASIEAWLT